MNIQLAAAERLEIAVKHIQHGWGQNATWFQGNVCAGGALIQAQQGNSPGTELDFSGLALDDTTICAVVALNKIIIGQSFRSLHYVAVWNDIRCHTKEEVISAMVAAAAMLRAAGTPATETNEQPEELV